MPQKKTYFNFLPFFEGILFLLFAFLSCIGMFHHELWGDEYHSWNIARDSASIPELLYNKRFEGHPSLWYLILFTVKQFTYHPFWMQLTHFFIALSVVFIFLKYSPFNKVFKALFIFGYFPFFEYNLLSRNYAIGLLFIFIACALYKNRRSNYLLLAFVLGLAANTHLLSLLAALSFFVLLGLDFLFKHQAESIYFNRKILFSLLVFFTLVFIAILHIKQPSESVLGFPFMLELFQKNPKESLLRPFIAFINAFIPLPNIFEYQFINTFLLFWAIKFAFGNSYLILPIFILLLSAVSLSLISKPFALLLFCLNTLGSMLLIFIFPLNSVRYCGFIFLIFVCSLWISRFYEQKNEFWKYRFLEKISQKTSPVFIFLILCMHTFAGVFAFSRDIRYPFSQAAEAVDFLAEIELLEKAVIFCDFYSATAISACLQKKVYNLDSKKWESYPIWNRIFSENAKNYPSEIKKILTKHKIKKAFLILHQAIGLKDKNIKPESYFQAKGLQLAFLKKFDKSIHTGSSYFVYRVE